MTELTRTAELTVAASIIADGSGPFARARASLTEDDFADRQTRAVFEAAGALAAAGAEITSVTLASKIEALGLGPDLATLERLAVDHHRPVELERMISRVGAAGGLRRTGARLRKLGEYAQHPEAVEDPDRYHAAVSALALGSRERLRSSTVGGVEAARRFMTALTERGKMLPASPTGIADLDGMLGGGLQAKRAYVFGARPSIGKSAFAVGSMYHGAEHGHPQLMFSLEMPVEDVFERRVVQVTGIDNERVARVRGPGGLTEPEMRQVIAATSKVLELPVELDCETRDLAAMLARARVWLDVTARPMVEQAHAESRPCVPTVWIDYLQRARLAGKFANRDERIGTMADMLASFSRDEKCAFGILAQLNRSSVKENRPPTMADLRESGSIEQDANVIVLLHRDSGASADGEGEGMRVVESDASFIVDKNRHGPIGTVRATWLGPTGRYVNHSRWWSE